MYLVSVQPVDHAAARFFQPTAPFDVVFLVKARLQLDQHQHVLAIFRRLAERLDNLALLGDAVQRHLDGNHAVVVGSFRQHFEERLHALVRIGKQLVLFANLRQNRPAVDERRGFLRNPPLIEQLAALAQHILQPKEEREIQRRGAHKHIFARHIHIAAQRIDDDAVQLAGKLQPHRRKALAALNQLHHKLAVIQIVVIERVRVDIRVARHAHQALGLDDVALKHLRNEMQNQLLGEHIRLFAGGNLDQPRENARAAGDDPQLILALLPLQHDHGVDILVAQERERLAAADDGGRNQRRDLRIKIAFEPLALLPADFSEIDQPNALLLQLFHQAGIDLVPPPVQFAHAVDHRVDLLPRGHVGLVFAQLGRNIVLIHQRTHAHHEKFVEVALIDGCEGEPFAKRGALILRLFKHSLVELEPGKLPVHKNVIHGVSSRFPVVCPSYPMHVKSI